MHHLFMRNKILIIILILVCSNAYGAYTGTMPKDIGTSTPLGSENPNILDDVVRERGTVQYNLYKIKSVSTDTTLLANDSWVIASSTSGILLTMPSASSVANGSATKPFWIKNINTGTVTLNITVDGIGSPTVTGSQTMSLFTDGTSWFEISANKAYALGGYVHLGTQTRGTIGLGTQTSGFLSLGTQTNGQLDLGGQTGLISLGTQTNSKLSLGTQTTGKLELGTQTNGSL